MPGVGKIDAFIGGFNSFLGVFRHIGINLPTVPTIQLLSVIDNGPSRSSTGGATGGTRAFAGGGIIPGYAPGVDSVLAMLSPGEAVLRPEVARAIGPATINAWNAAAMHFASGGIALAYNGHDSGTYSAPLAGMTSGESGGHLRGGLVVEQLIVQSAPGEQAAISVPRGLRNLALTYGL